MPDAGPQKSAPPAGSSPARAAAEALMARGMDLHDGGKLDEAIEVYKRATEADPSFVIAHNNLGMVYIDKGAFQEAVVALKRAVEADPGYAEAYNNLGYVHRRMKEDAKAAAYYEKFLELDPEVDDAPRIREWLQKVRSQVGEPLPAGALSGEEDAKPEIGSEDRTLILSSPLPPMGTAPGPAPAFDRAPPPVPAPPIVTPMAPPARPTPEAVCEKGIAAFEAGDLGQAEALLREAVSMNPALGVARSALGRVLAKAGHYAEAADELHEAVVLDPSDAAAFYVLGFTLKTLGMEHEAAEAYDRFLELTPDAPEGPKIRSWVEGVRSSPGLTPGELLARAAADIQAGRLDEAQAACEEVLAGDAANAAANVLMGRVLFEKGDYIRATTVLKRAEPASPDDPEIPFYLGQAYSQRGQADEAAQAFERCLRLAPDGPFAASAREWLEAMSGPQAAGGQCGYCFRSFPEEELSRHEGKLACRGCLVSLGAAAGPKAAAVVVRPTGVERVAAIEAARQRRRRSGAKAWRVVLTSVLVALLLVGILLLLMKNRWLEGPLDRIGVYWVVRTLGLEPALKLIGVYVPAKAAPRPDGDGDGEGLPDGGEGEEGGPKASPLVIRGPDKPVAAVPLAPLEVALAAQGGSGSATFQLVSGPPGMEVDSAEGVVRWRPLAGEKKLRLPSRHKVEVRAATARAETANLAFEIVVNLAFEEGALIDPDVPPGTEMHLAVGKLNVTKDRSPDTIAVAWGRYREGFVRLLYQSAAGRFTRGEKLALGGQPSALVVADVTGDGRADAVVANWYLSRIHVFRQDEAGGLVQDAPLRTAKGVCALAAGDADADGRTDIAAAHRAAADLHVYLQRAAEGGQGRLVGPETKTTTRASPWNRVFFGPLRGGAKGNVVYLMCGSTGEPLFKAFPVRDRKLDYYEPSRDERLLPEGVVEARLLHVGEGPPCVAALVGGEKPGLYVLGAKEGGLEAAARAEIELAPFPVTMEVADVNEDGADDVVVLYPEELRVYVNAGASGGPFHLVGVVDVPGGTGPLAVGELTGAPPRDLLVAREDGKLLVVKATVEVEP